MQHEHHYTIDEANDLLPWVGACVRRLQGARAEIVLTGEDALAIFSVAEEGGAWPGREHAEAALRFLLTLEQLQELDIVVRDLDRGLIDFPALIDGREVYLCWLVEEPQISHWHGIGGGFAGRRPF